MFFLAKLPTRVALTLKNALIVLLWHTCCFDQHLAIPLQALDKDIFHRENRLLPSCAIFLLETGDYIAYRFLADIIVYFPSFVTFSARVRTRETIICFYRILIYKYNYSKFLRLKPNHDS